LDIRWVKKTTSPEEKETRVKQVKSFAPAFKELDALLDTLIKEPKESDYSLPSWPYHRADLDGYNRAIRSIKKLIKET